MPFFNTAGPIRPQNHYHIPPLERLDLAGLRALIQQKKYFVLHAPRQTGKTSALLALCDLLNAEGRYRCAYVDVEVGQAGREDTRRAMQAILGELALRARHSLQDEFVEEIWFDALQRYGPDGALRQVLNRWAGADPTPLVLLIDEIDSLVGDTLVSVLRQLRAGYDSRPEAFPQSVVLCGVRDVRDYRIQSTAENAIITGGSVFNIKAQSLRLGDFSRQEVQTLLAQHTGATGQAFTDEALSAVWRQTQGQPWLVNALADEACFSGEFAEAWHRPVTAEAIHAAQEQLILRRETHLDQLADKLWEERVRRVVEPLLSGGEARSLPPDDLMYVRDLGLVSIDDPVRIANPVYREVVPRELTFTTQATLAQEAAWYVDAAGGLHKSLEQTIGAGLQQTADYMDRCEAEAGHLVIFDRREGRRWEDKLFHSRRVSKGGVEIEVWGM